MTKVTETVLAETINSLYASFKKELLEKTQDQLEENWFFKFDPETSLAQNIYDFYDLLKLYNGFCRQWEEEKGGHVCVVERVRDKYLMPKIKAFAEEITATYCSKE